MVVVPLNAAAPVTLMEASVAAPEMFADARVAAPVTFTAASVAVLVVATVEAATLSNVPMPSLVIPYLVAAVVEELINRSRP